MTVTKQKNELPELKPIEEALEFVNNHPNGYMKYFKESLEDIKKSIENDDPSHEQENQYAWVHRHQYDLEEDDINLYNELREDMDKVVTLTNKSYNLNPTIFTGHTRQECKAGDLCEDS